MATHSINNIPQSLEGLSIQKLNTGPGERAMALHFNGSMPEMFSETFESLLPGFSTFTHIVSFYLHVDIHRLSNFLALITILSSFLRFVLPQLLVTTQRALLCFAASIDIPHQDRLQGQFINWMSTNPSLRHTWHSIARTKLGFSMPWQHEQEDEDQIEDTDKNQAEFDEGPMRFCWSRRERNIKPVRCTPNQNQFHIFRYTGHLFGLYRTSHQPKNNNWLPSTETITIYSFWGRRSLIGLLDEVQQFSRSQKERKIGIYFAEKKQNMISWVLAVSKPPRPLPTVILPQEVKDNIVKDIQKFLRPLSKPWYQTHGIPYRRGYLFHGPPGTGKSSLCFAIAGLFGLDIYPISLNSSKIGDGELVTLFRTLPENCIVLLEDVDESGLQKSRTPDRDNDDNYDHSFPNNEPDSGGISLSALLNVIDGVEGHEGHILIMTTNHKERINEALTRPGRVDKCYHFGFANSKVIQEVFTGFYVDQSYDGSLLKAGNEAANHATEKQSGATLAEHFAGIVPPDRFTVAAIHNYLMNYRESPREAVEKAKAWVMDPDGHPK